MEFEIRDSLNYIQKLIPSKAARTIYLSGNCLPTEEQLAFILDHGYQVMNGGDTFFDRQHPSLTYVKPLFRQAGSRHQVYSSNANENVYTHLWSKSFWGMKRVLETYKNTGHPVRLKPANLYYHFYSFEKWSAYQALETIVKEVLEGPEDYIQIFPSEFIDLVLEFPKIKITRL